MKYPTFFTPDDTALCLRTTHFSDGTFHRKGTFYRVTEQNEAYFNVNYSNYLNPKAIRLVHTDIDGFQKEVKIDLELLNTLHDRIFIPLI